VDPAVLRYTTDYFIRLLVERHAIRSALFNPGGSVILTSTASRAEGAKHYSSVMGNDLHCDLLDAERIVNDLAPEDRLALLEWIDSMSAPESVYYAGVAPKSIKKRKEHREQALAIAGEQWKNRHKSQEGADEHGALLDSEGTGGCTDALLAGVSQEA
jgi:hypothetical protein